MRRSKIYIIHTTMDLNSKVNELRTRFCAQFKDKIESGAYHNDDIERLHKQDAFLRNVINSGPAGGDIEKAVAQLDEILLFRVEYKLHDIVESNLHHELRQKCFVFYKGTDKKGNKILHLKAAKAGSGKKLFVEKKQILLFRLFQHYRDNPDRKIIFLADMSGATSMNLNPEMGKFVTMALFRYFPCMCDSMLFFKMKPPLQVVYKLVQQFKDSRDQVKDIFVKRSNIQEYIDATHLEPHMIKEPKKKSK